MRKSRLGPVRSSSSLFAAGVGVVSFLLLLCAGGVAGDPCFKIVVKGDGRAFLKFKGRVLKEFFRNVTTRECTGIWHTDSTMLNGVCLGATDFHTQNTTLKDDCIARYGLWTYEMRLCWFAPERITTKHWFHTDDVPVYTDKPARNVLVTYDSDDKSPCATTNKSTHVLQAQLKP